MKILVTGGGGFLGRAELETQLGHDGEELGVGISGVPKRREGEESSHCSADSEDRRMSDVRAHGASCGMSVRMVAVAERTSWDLHGECGGYSAMPPEVRFGGASVGGAN